MRHLAYPLASFTASAKPAGVTAREARDLRRAWRRGRLPGPGTLPEVRNLSQVTGRTIYADRDAASLERLATAEELLELSRQVTQ